MSIKVFFNARGLNGFFKDSKEQEMDLYIDHDDLEVVIKSKVDGIGEHSSSTSIEHQAVFYIDPNDGMDLMSKYIRKYKPELLDKVTVIATKPALCTQSRYYVADIPFDETVSRLCKAQGHAIDLRAK